MRKVKKVWELLLCMNVYNTEFIVIKRWVSIKYYKVVFYTKKGDGGTQEYIPYPHPSPSSFITQCMHALQMVVVIPMYKSLTYQ